MNVAPNRIEVDSIDEINKLGINRILVEFNKNESDGDSLILINTPKKDNSTRQIRSILSGKVIKITDTDEVILSIKSKIYKTSMEYMCHLGTKILYNWNAILVEFLDRSTNKTYHLIDVVDIISEYEED